MCYGVTAEPMRNKGTYQNRVYPRSWGALSNKKPTCATLKDNGVSKGAYMHATNSRCVSVAVTSGEYCKRLTSTTSDDACTKSFTACAPYNHHRGDLKPASQQRKAF